MMDRGHVSEHRYVSEYLVTEHYGGPEEGGWFYYRYHFRRIITPRAYLLSSARAIARRFNARQHEYLESLSYSDRRHEDRIAFVTESFPRQRDTSREPRPHYC